jgi:[ribosomal protein S5]-alanine N-acetyltransferase
MSRLILTTPRLMLREISLDDLDFMCEMLGDPEVMRFYPQIYDRDGAATWITKAVQRYADHGHGLWLACDRESLEPRGQVGVLTQEVEGRSLIEVGWMIHRPFWRQGLASEAAGACHNWAFENTGCDVVHALIRPANVPSQGVARKLGMSPLPKTVEFRGYEHFLFRIGRDERRLV